MEGATATGDDHNGPMSSASNLSTIDLASNVLGAKGGGGLETFFTPRTVAVIGATEKQGSVGRAVLWNLISNPFGGTVYPINSNRPNVLGIKAYKDIKSVPDPVDLAVVVTPASTVPGVISECVDAGVTGAIVISAGFKESGPEGARLEQELLKEARRGGMRIIGPNCVGVMRPYSGMNATFAAQIARPGSVGFISQAAPCARPSSTGASEQRRLQCVRLDRLDA